MQAEGVGSHFSHNGPINFISRPDCYICKDASVDTHIHATYFRHLSLLYLTESADVTEDR